MDIPVYLDNHATTRTDPRVLEAMIPFFGEIYGNASSRTHAFGWKAQEALEHARAEVAAAIGAAPEEIVFTSGATESDNLAVFGAAEALRERGDHIVATAVEHHAVLDPLKALERRGFSTTLVRPDSTGRIDPEAVAAAITAKTILVSVMAANNEIGTINPLREIGRAVRARGVLFHTDAAQAAGKIPLRVDDIQADLLSISGHKIHGPKGVGALFVRRRSRPVRILPIIHGGAQERGLRPGTANVPGAVGLGAALRLAVKDMDAEAARIRTLRDRLHQSITERLDGVSLNGHPEERLPGSLSLSFAGVHGEALLISLKDLAVSSGSACTSATVEPSYVLRALGTSAELALATIRFGVGRFNTEEEIDFAARRVVETVLGLREMARVMAPRRAGGALGRERL
jgi:cysteine desulfurase